MVPPGGCPQSPTPGPQRPRESSLTWSTLLWPILRLWSGLPAALARTHIPTAAFSLSPATTYLPRERQLLPRLQCARLSLQHRGKYFSTAGTFRLGGGRGGTRSLLGGFSQTPCVVLLQLVGRMNPQI